MLKIVCLFDYFLTLPHVQVESVQTEKKAMEEQMEELRKDMEALRESRGKREVEQAKKEGSKVELQPHEQAAFSAARHGREEELEKLMDSVHVNVINEAGNTLLIVAAQVCIPACMRALSRICCIPACVVFCSSFMSSRLCACACAQMCAFVRVSKFLTVGSDLFSLVCCCIYIS